MPIFVAIPVLSNEAPITINLEAIAEIDWGQNETTLRFISGETLQVYRNVGYVDYAKFMGKLRHYVATNTYLEPEAPDGT